MKKFILPLNKRLTKSQQKNRIFLGLTTLGITMGALSLITLNSQATHKTSIKRSQTNLLSNNLLVQKTLGIRNPGVGLVIGRWLGNLGISILGGWLGSLIPTPESSRQTKLLEEIRDEQKREPKQQEPKREERREPIDRDDYSEKCDEWATTFLYPDEYPPRYCMELWDEENRRTH